ncbi:MAG: hypothetical protein KC613_03860 [Myxococcales bacterium]|nr:hypothetical protein [Myxococcales bacterium]MCB9522222.1 hypothetical protein [Myxococcales bacterium]
MGVVALAAVLLAPMPLLAQATPVANLWREFESARALWRVERAVLVNDVDRFREQRVKRRFGGLRKGQPR